MAELLDETGQLESTTVGVFRTAATVKGGRRFSFSAMVVVGDRSGRVGYGYGKSNEVPSAIEKAQKVARKSLITVPRTGRTIVHQVEGRFLSSRVRLVPASPGTGVVAGATVRAVLEMAGISDCLTKCFGSTNKANVVKAVFEGLERLRPPESVASARQVEVGKTEVEEKIETSRVATLEAESAGVDSQESKQGPSKNGSNAKGGGGGQPKKESPPKTQEAGSPKAAEEKPEGATTPSPASGATSQAAPDGQSASEGGTNEKPAGA